MGICAESTSTKITVLDEVLNCNKSIQLLRVDSGTSKFYRVRFQEYIGATGYALPFSTFKDAKRIFELSKTILLSFKV